MGRTAIIVSAVAASLALAGCVSTIENKEDMLSAAGFKIKPADTPDKLASLKALPAHKFVQQVQDGNVIYLYADPSICRCLYYGDQTAYGNYRQMVFQQNLADEQQMTAMMNQQAAMNWDWGVWGPGWY
jgi:hypothetical protein